MGPTPYPSDDWFSTGAPETSWYDGCDPLPPCSTTNFISPELDKMSWEETAPPLLDEASSSDFWLEERRKNTIVPTSEIGGYCVMNAKGMPEEQGHPIEDISYLYGCSMFEARQSVVATRYRRLSMASFVEQCVQVFALLENNYLLLQVYAQLTAKK